MVVGAFPAAKLGGILLRQISKPLANFLIHRAKQSPIFRNYICMPPAQFYNWCEVKTKMWILNLGKPVNVPVLSESVAIELGANLLGEGFIFSIAATMLILEWRRSSRKEAMIEENRLNEMEALKTEIQDLFIQVQEQQVLIKELTRQYGREDKKISAPVTENNSRRTPPSASSPVSKEVEIVTKPNEKVNVAKSTNILLNAVATIQEEFFYDTLAERDNGIVILALNHIYENVYKIPLSIY